MTLPPENIFGHTEKLRFFLEALEWLRAERRRGLHILDLGCGNGWAVTRHLAQPEDEVLGIDLHAPSIAYAQRSFARQGLSFRCANAETLHDDPLKWDVIVLADVLEHIDDPHALLSSCSQMLAPGGRVLVAIPNGCGPFELESALARVPILGPALLGLTDIFVAVLNKYFFRGLWTRAIQALPEGIPYNQDSPHVQFKSRRAWLELFSRAGYCTRAERNLAFISGPFSNYLLGASRGVCALNVRISPHLPPALVSNWVFMLESCNAKS